MKRFIALLLTLALTLTACGNGQGSGSVTSASESGINDTVSPNSADLTIRHSSDM